MNNNYLVTDRYEIDFTGKNPDNYIDNEVHDYNPLQTNRVVPRAGSYYHDTMIVYLNNQQLTWNVDYFPEIYDQKISELANKEASRMIRIADNYGSGELKISYQTPGSHGNYIDTIKELIQAIKDGSGSISWSSLRNLPLFYPPKQHIHSANELYGYDALVYGVYAIATAIKDCNIHVVNKINAHYNDLMSDIKILTDNVDLSVNEITEKNKIIQNKIDEINKLYNDFIDTKNRFISIINFDKTIRAINKRFDEEILPVLNSSLKYFSQLNEINLNSLKGSNRGMYSQSNADINGSTLNYPTDDARGTLFVYDDANGNLLNGGGCRQVFYCYNSFSTYNRYFNADTNTWSEWIPVGGNPDDAYVQYIYPNGTPIQPYNIEVSNEIILKDEYKNKSVLYIPEVKYLCKDNVRRWMTVYSELANSESSGINIERTSDGMIAIRAGSTNIVSKNISESKLPNKFVPNENITSAPFRIAVYRQSFIIGNGGGSGGGISNIDLQNIYDAIENLKTDIFKTVEYINKQIEIVNTSLTKIESNYITWDDVYNFKEPNKTAWKIPLFNGSSHLPINQAIIFSKDNNKRGIYLRDNMTLYTNTQFIATDFRIESDQRFKTELTQIDVDKLLNINVYQYKHKDGFYSYGVLAQEVEKEFPYAVSTYKGYKTVNYNALSAIAIGLLKKYLLKDNRNIGEVIEVLDGAKISDDYVRLNGQTLLMKNYPEFTDYLNKSEETKKLIKGESIILPNSNNDSCFIKYIKIR